MDKNVANDFTYTNFINNTYYDWLGRIPFDLPNEEIYGIIPFILN